MVGICFYYEASDIDVWSGKKLDAWNYACKAAGDISSAVVINRTEQKVESFDKSIDFQVFPSLEDANLTGHITLVVCPWDFSVSTPLWEFNHKTDWYVFGSASGWTTTRINSSNEKIHIPQNGRGSVHSIHAATTVMFHRYEVINK